MRRGPLLTGLLCLALAGGIAVWALSDHGGGESQGSAPEAPAGTAVPSGTAGSGRREPDPKPKPRARARRPGEVEPTGDALWDDARREAASGRFLEALERILDARRKAEGAWKEKVRTDEILTWEDAALDQFAASMRTMGRDDLLAWLRRLDTVVLDPVRRRRLMQLRRDLVEGGHLDLATILDVASPEARAAIERHLQRFAGTAPAGGKEPEPNHLDASLRSLRARNEQRPAPVEPLPADDAAAREQRRLEQIEKLRQREATGLLEPIASGLAWLALHQADDGEVSDDVVPARCTYLGHTLCTSQGAAPRGQYRLAGTALAVLAWLDFRDQDLRDLFEPSLALGVSWLRKQMKTDGSFDRQGYEAAMAMMALGQAAKASRSDALRKDVARGMKFVASKQSSDGGYRYSWGNPGDLSVTGWYVQAYEQARDAGKLAPETLVPGLEKFVRSVWRGGPKFSYLAADQRERPTLGGVGILSLQILNPEAAAKEADGWAAALATGATRGNADLYQTYYDVRAELALQGQLSDARRRVLADLPRAMQRSDPSSAGMFSPTVVDPVAQRGKKGQAIWSSLGWLDRGGRSVATAFAVLTMEHALYRR